MRLSKQIKLLEQEINLQKAELFDDYTALKQKLGTTPNLLKGFLWGLSLGFLIIAPKIKHLSKPDAPKSHPKTPATKHKDTSLQRILLASLPGLIKLL
ncbi:MAG TPA: hypothetical protein VHE99_07485 [Gammaproteobacteria bacterium]|nr:hypothetical protein [Gammaproteobacteria bacterium]